RVQNGMPPKPDSEARENVRKSVSTPICGGGTRGTVSVRMRGDIGIQSEHKGCVGWTLTASTIVCDGSVIVAYGHGWTGAAPLFELFEYFERRDESGMMAATTEWHE